MKADHQRFIDEYLREIREDSAAIFAGAGLSAAAGYVDWRNLLRPIAEELNLDIDRESDLILIAQYHFNENASNRSRLNQLLITELAGALEPTENHRLLARLPISTYWTTNYDRLIETALRNAGKVVDVKYALPHLATTKPRRDAVVYKMHGDIENPAEVVLIKDDYEHYHLRRGAFVNALAGDLISKTLLFLGFSFTDPNLDYVLSRIRVTFQQNQRRHYCIFRRRTRQPRESEIEFEQALTKQTLAIGDLRRFNIRTLLVDDYSEITEILRVLERRYRQRTVFISGSASEYGPWASDLATSFVRDLSRRLVREGYRVVTGFGLGLGDAVISGALEEIYSASDRHIEDSLVMRPFPQSTPDPDQRKKLWEQYRQELISLAGIAVILFGNKSVDGRTVPADGVRREFEIAREHGLALLPVGATGYVAEELWREVTGDFEGLYPEADQKLRFAMEQLGAQPDDPHELIAPIMDMIATISKE